MNKIMELAHAMAITSIARELGPLIDARRALQAEVNRVEAELAALRAKVAEMEGQEPVAWIRQWSFNGGETVFELYDGQDHCQKDAAYYGGICAPLYLAPGAKP